MRIDRSAIALLIAAAVPNGSACAMAQTSAQAVNCTVQNAEKLPPALGGEAAVCSIIDRLVLPSVRSAGLSPSSVSVSVNVKSQSLVSAVAVVNGSAMAEQNVASSDRALGASAIEMLGKAIATQIAKIGA